MLHRERLDSAEQKVNKRYWLLQTRNEIMKLVIVVQT